MIRKGFTLIEILIVVAIIAILASVVLIGLGPTQRIGRDARRIADLRQVQNGLELYFNKCGYYPGITQPTPLCGPYSEDNTWVGVADTLRGSNIGVTQIPNDPLGGRSYFYSAATTNGASYVLGARLEDTGNQALIQDIDGEIYGVDCADPVYCIQL